MAPDSEKLRQRIPAAASLKDSSTLAADAAATQSTAADRLCASLKSLKPTEVAIDGIIYDLEGFDHPGGETILLFGGNDVTVQYKMIHPYHTDKHLLKMKRVGKVVDYISEYKFDTEFEREIKKEVFKIVHRGREFGTFGWFARAFFYIGFFFYLQYLWVTQGSSWSLAIVYGISQALIGLNVQHDANHGASSKISWINDLFGLGADFIGGSKWLWLEQHWTHHTYTNHAEKDPYSFGAEPMMIFNDYPIGHPNRKWYHNLQAFYYILVLAGYWVSSVFNPQILDLRQRGALSVGIQMENDWIKSRRKYAIALRLLYIYVNIICPFQSHGVTWKAFSDIMIMGVAESLTLAVLFSLSHNFVYSDRDPTADTRKTGEPVCWFKSQVETSSTYGGAISGYLTGGLNFQVEHHLFPRMSSAWYPYIAPKVREICEKHGVRYVYYPWVWQNLISTVKYMHAAGTAAHWRNNPYFGRL
jgi:fatty acid desaturase (delta-4 desaturase)